MTTHWNTSLNEQSPILPAHIPATPDLRRSSSNAMTRPRPSELLLTLEANEVFLAFLETPPDFSHCGINE